MPVSLVFDSPMRRGLDWEVTESRFSGTSNSLILRGHLDVVDDEALIGASATFDLEAEAIHYAEDGDYRVFVLSIVGRQIVVVGARDSGLLRTGS